MLSTALHRLASALVFVSTIALASKAAAADEPAPAAPPAEAVCALDASVGVAEDDARAVELVLCGLFAEHPAAGSHHRVRLVRIGSKIVVTVVSAGPHGGTRSKRLVLTSIDEITVAGPRLFEASAEDKPIEETETASNVVGEETRKPKKRSVNAHFWLGMIGAVAPGIGNGGGAAMALSLGNDRWSFVSDLRIAGESFNRPAALALGIFTLGSVEVRPRTDFAYVSLSAGARHHFSPATVAPFAGAGFALDYLGRGTARGNDADGTTGLAGYAELGVDFLRSSAVGGAISLRADAPAFFVKTTAPTRLESDAPATRSTWAPVVSASVAFRF